jgi:hypothetical protein
MKLVTNYGSNYNTFQSGGIKMSHSFYVASDMNRNVLLGRDWHIQNELRFMLTTEFPIITPDCELIKLVSTAEISYKLEFV